MNWTDVASNQTFSGNTLTNAVDNGFFTVPPISTPIPLTNKQLTKSQVQSMINGFDNSGKAANQLLYKSNVSAIATCNVLFRVKLSSFGAGWRLVLKDPFSGAAYPNNGDLLGTTERVFTLDNVAVGTIFSINIDNGMGSAFIATQASKIGYPPSAMACSYVNQEIQINNTSETNVYILGNPSVICYPF
jgi:hypothetical protein